MSKQETLVADSSTASDPITPRIAEAAARFQARFTIAWQRRERCCMAASDEARRFLQKASQDEYVLARLLEDPAAPDEQLGFHAQQAVEKLLKAALFLAGGQPPRTHHLA